MNLDSFPTLLPLAPAEWTMEISRQGCCQHTAEVKYQEVPMCRLSIALPEQSESEIRTALAEKARRWISEYLARPSL